MTRGNAFRRVENCANNRAALEDPKEPHFGRVEPLCAQVVGRRESAWNPTPRRRKPSGTEPTSLTRGAQRTECSRQLVNAEPRGGGGCRCAERGAGERRGDAPAVCRRRRGLGPGRPPGLGRKADNLETMGQ